MDSDSNKIVDEQLRVLREQLADGKTLQERAAETKAAVDAGEEEAPMPGDSYVPLNPKFDPHVVGTFSTELSWKDRQRLYAIIRKIHFAKYPKDFVTEREMDKLIDAWGPKVQQYEIMRHLERGTIT